MQTGERCRVNDAAQVYVPPQEVVAVADVTDNNDSELEELREQVAVLDEEVVTLRRRLVEAPKRVRTLEERLLETKGQLAQAVSQN